MVALATLSFSDHRGLVPDEKFEVKGNSLTTRHKVQDDWIRQDCDESECRGLTELFRQTLRVVVLRLGPSEAARGLPSGLPLAHAPPATTRGVSAGSHDTTQRMLFRSRSYKV